MQPIDAATMARATSGLTLRRVISFPFSILPRANNSSTPPDLRP